MPYCPNCGEKVSEDNEFCPNCGAEIEKEEKKTPKSKRKEGKTSLNLEQNVEGALCYILGWITGIIFLIIEEKNNFVRFHAMQSIITFLPLNILIWVFGAIGGSLWWGFSPFFIFTIISWLIGLVTLILWLILMVKAYQGERYKLPIAGNIAEEQA